MKLKIESCGNGAAVKLPESLLQQLAVGIGDSVDVSINGNVITLSRIKPKYKLEDLLAQCQPGPPIMEDWDKMPPVGKEII